MHHPFGNLRLYFVVIIVNLASLTCGMMLTWPSPLLRKLTKSNDNPLGRTISAQEQSWIAALGAIGGIFGPCLASLVMEKFGRKPALALVHLANIVATLTAALGNDIWYYYISRISAGMSIYSTISVGAIYFVEIAPSRYRGIMFSTTSIFINLGALVTCCIGPYMSIKGFNLLLLGIVLVALVGTVSFIPESPYYLLQNNLIVKAQKSLEALRGTSDVHRELKLIQEGIARIHQTDAKVKTKAARRAFVRALGLVVLQQLSGINVIIYTYTEMVFREAGIDLSNVVSTILVAVVQFLSVIFIATVGVDWFGRKKMLTFSSFGLAFILGVLGTFFHYDDHQASKINWLPLLFLMLYAMFLNSGLGGLPFLYMSEILPLNVKSLGSAFIMASYCLVSFLITYFYNDITDSIGISGGFYIFSAAMAAFALYVLIFLFETRGKSLKDIHERLSRSKRSKEAFSQKVDEQTCRY